MLLCGPSGAGKSCLAYACARAGFTFISDNDSWLARDSPAALVAGDPRRIRFRDTAAELFGDLRGGEPFLSPAGKRSIDLPQAGLAGLRTAFHHPVHGLAFLNRGGSNIAPFPSGRVMGELLATVPDYEPDVFRRTSRLPGTPGAPARFRTALHEPDRGRRGTKAHSGFLMTIWEARPAIAKGVAAALAALRFEDPVPLPALSDAEWACALAFCDRAHLTLPLGAAAGAALPATIRTRIEGNLARNCERTARLLETWDQVASALAGAGIEAAVLKGFSHWGEYTGGPGTRLQYDLDLYAPQAASAARDALKRLGYTLVPGMERAPMDHLPALGPPDRLALGRAISSTPPIPSSVEVHYRLWDERTEAFPAPGLEAFWERRVERSTAGRRYLALHPADAFGYAALHALRHMLRGDLRAGHVYELAWFLHQRRTDDAFWDTWRELHDPPLRGLGSYSHTAGPRVVRLRPAPAAAREAAVTLPAGGGALVCTLRRRARGSPLPPQQGRACAAPVPARRAGRQGAGDSAGVSSRRFCRAFPRAWAAVAPTCWRAPRFHWQALSTMLRTRR